MTDTDDRALQLQETSSSVRVSTGRNPEENRENASQSTPPRSLNSKRTQTRMLVGSALLQLPIWGMPLVLESGV